VGSGLSHFGGMSADFAVNVAKLGVVCVQAGIPELDRAYGGLVHQLFSQEAAPITPHAG
jgi:hypothetical protein